MTNELDRHTSRIQADAKDYKFVWVRTTIVTLSITSTLEKTEYSWTHDLQNVIIFDTHSYLNTPI